MLAVRAAHGSPLRNSGEQSRAVHARVMRLRPGVKRKAGDDGNGWRGGMRSCPLDRENCQGGHGQLPSSAQVTGGQQLQS